MDIPPFVIYKKTHFLLLIVNYSFILIVISSEFNAQNEYLVDKTKNIFHVISGHL